jgi:hypothetical protein
MALFQARSAALQQRINALGFGQGRRAYAVTGVMGGLAQLGQRVFVGLGVLIVVLLIALRPPSVFIKAVVTIAVVLAGFALRLLWRRLSVSLGLNKCYLYPGGMVVTNLLGQVRAAVPWGEMTSAKLMIESYGLMSLHRIQVQQLRAAPLEFVVLGTDHSLLNALQQRIALNSPRP